MPADPFPSDLVSDGELEQMLQNLCKRPDSYLPNATLGSVCGYVQGFDAARNGGLLVGLHQWLVVKHDGPNNVHWSWRMSALARKNVGESASENEAIAEFAALMAQFLSYRRKKGLTTIFYEYARWLLSKSWYDGPVQVAQQALAADARKPSRG